MTGRAWAASESLAELPRRGRIVPEFGIEVIRELFVDSYRLIYEVDPELEIVAIAGFIHGARDLAAVWEREERGEVS